MHRLDICRATHHEMSMIAEHDGRLVALVVRDLAKRLVPHLRKASKTNRSNEHINQAIPTLAVLPCGSSRLQ